MKNKTKPRIYICGPISGLPKNNKPAFLKAEKYIKKYYPDYEAINPHKVCAKIVRQHKGTDYELWNKCMRADIAQLVTCQYIYILPGSQNSKGAIIEQQIAVALNIKPLYFIDDLTD